MAASYARRSGAQQGVQEARRERVAGAGGVGRIDTGVVAMSSRWSSPPTRSRHTIRQPSAPSLTTTRGANPSRPVSDRRRPPRSTAASSRLANSRSGCSASTAAAAAARPRCPQRSSRRKVHRHQRVGCTGHLGCPHRCSIRGAGAAASRPGRAAHRRPASRPHADPPPSARPPPPAAVTNDRSPPPSTSATTRPVAEPRAATAWTSTPSARIELTRRSPQPSRPTLQIEHAPPTQTRERARHVGSRATLPEPDIARHIRAPLDGRRGPDHHVEHQVAEADEGALRPADTCVRRTRGRRARDGRITPEPVESVKRAPLGNVRVGSAWVS